MEHEFRFNEMPWTTEWQHYRTTLPGGRVLSVWYDEVSDPDNPGWAYQLFARDGSVEHGGTLDETDADALESALTEALLQVQ